AAAFALCERALALAPDVGEAWAARGYLHYSRGEHVDAVPDYAQAARLDPGRKVYRHNLGVNLAKAGDHTGALAAFDHALALAPDDKDVHVQRVLSLQALGRDEAAAAGLEALLRRWPTDVDAATTLGLLRFKRGEHAAAVEAYGLASRLRPDDAMHLVNRAVNLLELGRLEQALDDCERALALSPRLASAWRVRGEVRLRAGAFASAIADLERSFELRADPLTQRLLDEARARLGR
ncbi:MAG: tetratricopeptide repeat protein, partial [Planctomycetota bacterium]|nr:tetratricopeptide repeat protein [Planctomycetota bacterium]